MKLSSYTLIYSSIFLLAINLKAEDVSLSNQLTHKPASLLTHQNKTSGLSIQPNSISLEVGGRGGIYSFNYERLFSIRSSLGIGFSTYNLKLDPSIGETKVDIKALPIFSNFYFPIGSHRPFLSTSVTLLFIEAESNFDLGKIFGPLQFSTSEPDGNKQVSVQQELPKINSTVSLTYALPSLGAGYEYRTRSGANLRAQGFVIYIDKLIPWMGLSMGVGF